MIVESKAKNETELAQYARTKSVYIEQLRQGRVICEKANGNHSFERDHLNTGETKSAGYYIIIYTYTYTYTHHQETQDSFASNLKLTFSPPFLLP